MKKQISAILLSAFLLANFSAFAAQTAPKTAAKATTKTTTNATVKTVPQAMVLPIPSNELVTEHLALPSNVAKHTPTTVVVKTPTQDTILEYNVFEVVFAENFESKNATVGQHIPFVIRRGLRTLEGSVIVPEGTNIDAVITRIEKPKSFNRSGKVEIQFKQMNLPDGRVIPINAKLATKKQFLSRGKVNALGKGLGSALGGAAVGTGAGCGIGAAAGAVIVGGFAIGLPIGIAVGGIAGLVTPGLQYKAKIGDKILIQLTDNLSIAK